MNPLYTFKILKLSQGGGKMQWNRIQKLNFEFCCTHFLNFWVILTKFVVKFPTQFQFPFYFEKPCRKNDPQLRKTTKTFECVTF